MDEGLTKEQIAEYSKNWKSPTLDNVKALPVEWSVMPVRVFEKKPRKGFSWKNKTAEELRKAFEEERKFNIALRTGDCGNKVNFFAIDFDIKPGKRSKALELYDGIVRRLNEEEIIYACQRTRSGGYHLVFRYSEKVAHIKNCSEINKIEGLDIRNNNGYILIEPSCIPQGPNDPKQGGYYQWEDDHNLEEIWEELDEVPDWILDIIAPMKKKVDVELSPDEEDKKEDEKIDDWTPEHYKQILNLFTPDRCSNHDLWKKVIFACANASGKNEKVKKEVIEWSKNNPDSWVRGGSQALETAWRGARGGVTKGSLHFWAKEDNPKGYASFMKQFKKKETKKVSGSDEKIRETEFQEENLWENLDLWRDLFKILGTDRVEDKKLWKNVIYALSNGSKKCPYVKDIVIEWSKKRLLDDEDARDVLDALWEKADNVKNGKHELGIDNLCAWGEEDNPEAYKEWRKKYFEKKEEKPITTEDMAIAWSTGEYWEDVVRKIRTMHNKNDLREIRYLLMSCFRVIIGTMDIIVKTKAKDHGFNIFNPTDFYKRFNPVTFHISWTEIEEKNGKEKEVEKTKWLFEYFNNDDLFSVDRFEFGFFSPRENPANVVESGVLNIARSYTMKDLGRYEDWTEEMKEKHDAIVRPRKEHIFNIIAQKNEGLYHYIMAVLSHGLINPRDFLKAMLIFCGPQGAGKSIVFEWIRRIYGTHLAMVVKKVEEVLGEKNGDLVGKIFLYVEELDAGDSKENRRNYLSFKGTVTMETMRIRLMRVDPYHVPNYLHYHGCSNASHAFYMEGDDRRTFMTDVSGELKGNFEFFNKFNGTLTEEEINHLGTMFLNWDYKGVLIQNPPSSDAKKRNIEASERIFDSFLRRIKEGDFDKIVKKEGHLYILDFKKHERGVTIPKQSFIEYYRKIVGGNDSEKMFSSMLKNDKKWGTVQNKGTRYWLIPSEEVDDRYTNVTRENSESDEEEE